VNTWQQQQSELACKHVPPEKGRDLEGLTSPLAGRDVEFASLREKLTALGLGKASW
jgi:hypothetical protein